MKRILTISILALAAIFAPAVHSQSSGPTVPPPPYCTSANAGAIYTDTGTSPATVYTCSYYNLTWQWVVNPSYGGLVSYPTVPSTCSGALPVFLAGWPDTQMYICVNGVPDPVGTGIGSFTYLGTSAPSAVCSALVNNGYIATNATPQAYQCTNATGSYAWNILGGGSGCGTGTPCTIAEGGTGATTAAGALANLGAQPADLTGTADPPAQTCSVFVNYGVVAISATNLQYYCNGSSWIQFGGSSITLTTLGSSGASTLTGGVLNIPVYTGGGGSGTVNAATANQIAYYAADGTAVSGQTSVPGTAGGTGATSLKSGPRLPP